MNVESITRQFVKDVRSCYPSIPEAIPEGSRLFEMQGFDRKLSIAVTARAVVRSCAAHAFEKPRMAEFFRGDLLHFQHLYVIDMLMSALPQFGRMIDSQKDYPLGSDAHGVIALQIAIAQCELSQDLRFGFSKPQ
jgi:hypothetical protein